MCHDKLSLIIGIQEQFKICKSIVKTQYINATNNKNHMNISIDVEKAFDKNPQSSMIKIPEDTFLSMTKTTYDKHIADTIQNGAKLKAFTVSSGPR
jgi:hypothetical protein